MLANINLDSSSTNNPKKKFVVSDLHGSTFGDLTDYFEFFEV